VRISLLEDVCCAVAGCEGRLSLDSTLLAPLDVPNDGAEIVEGVLTCGDCDASFPILCGLAILLPDAWSYAAGRRDHLLEVAAAHDLPIRPAMLEIIEEQAAASVSPRTVSDKYETAETVNEYLAAHYDDLREALPSEHPFRRVLSIALQEDFYTAALDLLRPHLNGPRIGLDIGCSVGRATYELAEFCRRVYGIEIAFLSALTARRMLRGFPDAPRDYPLRFEGSRGRRRPLQSRLRENVEILVASAEYLPFPSSSVGVTNSWNVIDRLPDPERALAEQERVTSPAGTLSLTSPYNWETSHTPRHQWIGGQGDVPTLTAIRERIAGRLDILEERQHLPWVFMLTERYFEVFFSHGLIARKRAESGSEK